MLVLVVVVPILAATWGRRTAVRRGRRVGRVRVAAAVVVVAAGGVRGGGDGVVVAGGGRVGAVGRGRLRVLIAIVVVRVVLLLRRRRRLVLVVLVLRRGRIGALVGSRRSGFWSARVHTHSLGTSGRKGRCIRMRRANSL